MRTLTLSIALVLGLAACGAGEDVASRPEPAAVAPGAGLTVVATLFPLAWMAEQVAPGAEVVFLGARGQDPHDLELSPGDRTLLETADVVVHLGDLGFQPQVESALETRAGRIVDVRATLGERGLRAFDDDHGHEEDDHGHDEDDGDFDPHVWFDPGAMAEVAEDLGAAFADADPAGADAYRARARALHDELVDLAGEIDEMLGDCRQDTAIVSHEAYAYLLEPRGLEQEGISGAGGHTEVSPQRLAELADRIRAEGIPAVLAEPFEGRADAEALAAEAGVDLLEIDPLEIVTDEMHETGYVQLLREQAQAFAAALECD